MKKFSPLLLATTLLCSSSQSFAMNAPSFDEDKENISGPNNTKKNSEQRRKKPTGLKVLQNLSQTKSRNKKLPNNESSGTYLQEFEKLQLPTYAEDKDLWARLAYAFELSPFSSSMLKKSLHESQTSFNRKKVLSGIYYLYGMAELHQCIFDPDKPHWERAAEHFVQSCMYGGYEAIHFLQQAKHHEHENAKLFYELISDIFISNTDGSIDDFISQHLNKQRALDLTDDSIDEFHTYWTEGKWKKNPAEALYYSKEIIKALETALKDRKKLTPVKRQQQEFFTRAKKGQPKFLPVFAEIVHEKSYGFENTQDEVDLNVLINNLLSDETKAKSPVKKLYVQGRLSGKYGFKEDKKAAELFLAKDENKHSVAAYVLKMNNKAQDIKQVSDIKVQEEILTELVHALIETALKAPSKTISMGKKRSPLQKTQPHVVIQSLEQQPQVTIPRQIMLHPSSLEVLQNLLQSNFQSGDLPSFEILERQTYKEDKDLWDRLVYAIKLSPLPPSMLKKPQDESQTSFNRKRVLSWLHHLYGMTALIQDTPDSDKPHLGKAAEHLARACMYGGDEAIHFLKELQQHKNEYAKALYNQISNIFTLNTWKNINDFIASPSNIQGCQRLTFNSIDAPQNITQRSNLKKYEKELRKVAYAFIKTALNLPHEEISLVEEPRTPRVEEVVETVELILPPVMQAKPEAPPVEPIVQPIEPVAPLIKLTVQEETSLPHHEPVEQPIKPVTEVMEHPAEPEVRSPPRVEPPRVHITPAAPLIKPSVPQTIRTVPAAVNKYKRAKQRISRQRTAKHRNARKVRSARISQSKKIESRLLKTQKRHLNRSSKRSFRAIQRLSKAQKRQVNRKTSRTAQWLSKTQKRPFKRASRKKSRVAR